MGEIINKVGVRSRAVVCIGITKRLTMCFSLCFALWLGLGSANPVSVFANRVGVQEPQKSDTKQGLKSELKSALQDSEKLTPQQAEAQRLQNFADALPGLKKHLRENPNDVKTRAKYAGCLFQVGDARAAWIQLMKARTLDPENKGLVFGIDSLMNHFISKNIFAVGKPFEKIEGVLGEPTKRNEGEIISRYHYAHWAIDFHKGALWRIINLKGVTEAHFVSDENLDLDLDNERWIPGLYLVSNSGVSTHFYTRGESVRSYTEKVELERLLGMGVNPLGEVTKKLIAHESKAMPGSKHEIIKQSETSVTFEVEVPARGGKESQHRLVCLLKGEKDLYCITRIKLGPEPELSSREAWLEIFQAAKLDKKETKAEERPKTEPVNEGFVPEE